MCIEQNPSIVHYTSEYDIRDVAFFQNFVLTVCGVSYFLLRMRVNTLLSIFPLSCVHVHAHTGRKTIAHKKTWCAHKCFFKKCFAHISYTSFHIQISSGKMLPKRNFMHIENLKS